MSEDLLTLIPRGTNNGAWSSTISPGSSVIIPKGYHNGNGSVSASNSTSLIGFYLKGKSDVKYSVNTEYINSSLVFQKACTVRVYALAVADGDNSWGKVVVGSTQVAYSSAGSSFGSQSFQIATVSVSVGQRVSISGGGNYGGYGSCVIELA